MDVCIMYVPVCAHVRVSVCLPACLPAWRRGLVRSARLSLELHTIVSIDGLFYR